MPPPSGDKLDFSQWPSQVHGGGGEGKPWVQGLVRDRGCVLGLLRGLIMFQGLYIHTQPRLWAPLHPLVPALEGQGDFSLIAGGESPDLLVAAIITSNPGGSRSGVLLSVWGRGPTYQHCSQAFCPQSLQGTLWG